MGQARRPRRPHRRRPPRHHRRLGEASAVGNKGAQGAPRMQAIGATRIPVAVGIAMESGALRRFAVESAAAPF